MKDRVKHITEDKSNFLARREIQSEPNPAYLDCLEVEYGSIPIAVYPDGDVVTGHIRHRPKLVE